ncbi:MAG: CHAT domain-containing protein [Rubrobacter sp.]|nr:CHAT domain-containing protein [Rubrobacter sp.]MDQ3409601.1 CHAT domain-containing protein [Actinomycetota bacterium]
MPDNDEIGPGLVDELLALPTREQQAQFLRGKDLLDASGLDRLLDEADRLLNDDPGKARRLAETYAGLADAADAPATVPRADYIRAGAHNINGEFEDDLRLTKAAHDGYLALGMNLEALRTNVGRMDALLELGRYGEALDSGQTVLHTLGREGALDVEPTSREGTLLTALVHQNRGLCYEYTGRYEEALDAYASAERRYTALGMPERVGEILDNRGAILLHLGRSSEALEARETAARIFEEAGLTLSHAKALVNIGEAHLHLGNYARSLDAFERTRHMLTSIHALADQHLLLRDMADAYLELNLYSEALATYREAEEALRAAGMVHDRARVLWGAGSTLAHRRDFEEAEEKLTEAAALFGEAGNVPLLSGVMLEQASLQATRGDRAAALTTAHRALELVSRDDLPVQQIYARLRLADLLLPDMEEAENHLLAAQRLSESLALPQLRYRLNERLGHLRRLQGRNEEAQALLETAVDEIERLRGTVTQDAMRVSFLRDKTAAYADLLLLHLARGDDASVRRAFVVAERAKSRALVDLLTGISEREPPGLADPELGRRIRTLQADLNLVYGGLLGDTGDGEHPAPLPDLHARAIGLEQEIGRLRLRATADGSTPDPFAAPTSSDAIQDQLPSDVMLLAYHVVGDEILAFVVTEGGIRIARGLGTVARVQHLLHKLDVQWDRLRAGGGLAERHMAVLKRSTQQVLAALYDELVAPVEQLLDGTGAVPELAIVPHGPLHRIPFHALFDGRRYLIERFEISYAPSAMVYALCQVREAPGRNGATVLGVEDPLIPAAEAEARAVSKRLPGARLCVGEEATVEALRGAAPGSGTLHLACHGLFRSDNPMFSALKLHDGWLTAADVMNLDLPGALVTLSACESGRSGVIGGDEILGLTRAFLGTGAATLVVSLWLVQDDTTAELMSIWYGRLRGGEKPATALRAAQLEVKDRYDHPYYWAPFVLVGKR